MDLASPLHPTSLLPLERNESQDIDPPSIPLPQSPAPHEPETPEEANLKRVATELDIERRRLEGEEIMLSELRGIVKDLQTQIMNGEEMGANYSIYRTMLSSWRFTYIASSYTA
jgi:hypothetical protein